MYFASFLEKFAYHRNHVSWKFEWCLLSLMIDVSNFCCLQNTCVLSLLIFTENWLLLCFPVNQSPFLKLDISYNITSRFLKLENMVPLVEAVEALIDIVEKHLLIFIAKGTWT